MDFIEAYFDGKGKIYEYFGYQPGWTIYPLEDMRHAYWHLTSNRVWWCETEDEPPHYPYCADLLSSRNCPTQVFRKEKYTLIAVDTHCDGNRFLCIFSNDKERPDIKPADEDY